MAEKRMTDGSMALQEKKYRVITIEATEKPKDVKLRVAAYARVSSASDDQLNSFAAQNAYYTSLISSKENWSMVDIYADEGITGTSAEKREDFQRLLADCRRGLIDRVLVKSISRFARNTKECLEAIRELKSLGVGVCFEKENIDTATMSGEMMTALFASFAQAESESISGNMRWSYQRRMQSGKFITCKAPFGYRLKNGTLEIEESEAKIVRQIFDMYLSGYSKADIAGEITKLGVPTRDGNTYWQQTTISYVLQNERYSGNALLQKKYTTNTLPYQKKRNNGEKDQYFVTGSNQPIISQEVFDAVQSLMRKRAQKIVTGTEASLKPVIVDLKVCNITDPCLIRTICGELLLQQVLLAVFLILLKLLFGIDSNAAQVEFLHDRGNALGADSDTAFGQCNANLFGTIPLAAVVEGLLYQTYELRLFLVTLAAVCTAKDVVVKCTASDIQCFT